MARIARFTLPGTTYHFITRFVDRHWFFTDATERAAYLRMLGRALGFSDWSCSAYALMSNHIHLQLRAGRTPLEGWLRRIHGPFAAWMNKRHGRLGPILADRPKLHAFLPEKVGSLTAYIHNNPVRAGVVARASGSSWTSHRAYLGSSKCPDWLRASENMKNIGCDSPAAFDAFVDATAGERDDPDYADFHRAARIRGGLDLATPVVSNGDVMFPLVAKPFAHVRPDPARVVTLVAAALALPAAMVCSRRRLPDLVRARSVIAYVGLVAGITAADIARTVGVSSQAILMLARRPRDAGQGEAVAIVTSQLEMEMWAKRRAS